MIPRPATMFLVATLMGCQAESFSEIEAQRSPLLPGFESYASRSEVLPKVGGTTPPQVIEDSSLPKGDRRPPFSVFTVRVAEFMHLGQLGSLRLSFFNDRLQQTTFYPADPTRYLELLKMEGLSIAEGQRIKVANVVVWSAVDHQGQRYVAWADQRLQDQTDRWIARYS